MLERNLTGTLSFIVNFSESDKFWFYQIYQYDSSVGFKCLFEDIGFITKSDCLENLARKLLDHSWINA